VLSLHYYPHSVEEAVHSGYGHPANEWWTTEKTGFFFLLKTLTIPLYYLDYSVKVSYTPDTDKYKMTKSGIIKICSFPLKDKC
jgi:hypothetical protein